MSFQARPWPAPGQAPGSSPGQALESRSTPHPPLDSSFRWNDIEEGLRVIPGLTWNPGEKRKRLDSSFRWNDIKDGTSMCHSRLDLESRGGVWRNDGFQLPITSRAGMTVKKVSMSFQA